MKGKGIATLIPVVLVLSIVGIAGVVGTMYLTESGPFKTQPGIFKGHFDSFGDDKGTDNLVEKNPATFDDEGQTTEGNASAEYSLTRVANESFTGDSSAYVNLAKDDLEPTSVTVRNATDDSIVASSEYTMNYTDGGIKVTSTWDTASMEVTYNWMPMKRGNTIAKIYFEIDGRTRGGTIAIDWAGTNVTPQNTYIDEAKIKTYDEGNTVQELDIGKLQSEEEVHVQSLGDREYIIYMLFHHDDFTPNVNSGTYEKGLDLDFTLDSDATDEPVEVEDYTIYAKTVAP